MHESPVDFMANYLLSFVASFVAVPIVWIATAVLRERSELAERLRNGYGNGNRKSKRPKPVHGG
jgi:hypothetical protein